MLCLRYAPACLAADIDYKENFENLIALSLPRPSHRFADHLKNTEFKWPFWKHWLDVVQLQPDHAQRMFVTNALAALVKLSYTDRWAKKAALRFLYSSIISLYSRWGRHAIFLTFSSLTPFNCSQDDSRLFKIIQDYCRWRIVGHDVCVVLEG